MTRRRSPVGSTLTMKRGLFLLACKYGGHLDDDCMQRQFRLKGARPGGRDLLAAPWLYHPTGRRCTTNEFVARFVFVSTSALDDQALAAAKKTSRSRGATLLKSLAGTMLLEVTPAQVPEVAQALQGWRYSAERKTTWVPERKPLERSKARGALAAAAKG